MSCCGLASDCSCWGLSCWELAMDCSCCGEPRGGSGSGVGLRGGAAAPGAPAGGKAPPSCAEAPAAGKPPSGGGHDAFARICIANDEEQFGHWIDETPLNVAGIAAWHCHAHVGQVTTTILVAPGWATSARADSAYAFSAVCGGTSGGGTPSVAISVYQPWSSSSWAASGVNISTYMTTCSRSCSRSPKLAGGDHQGTCSSARDMSCRYFKQTPSDCRTRGRLRPPARPQQTRTPGSDPPPTGSHAGWKPRGLVPPPLNGRRPCTPARPWTDAA